MRGKGERSKGVKELKRKRGRRIRVMKD